MFVVAAAWPLAARAQPARLPVVGFLFSEAWDTSKDRADTFRQGLKDAGYVEGENVLVEYRWGDGRRDRLPALAADLINRKVAVICAGNINSALAAKAVAGATPIVFLTAGDPVADGLVASFNKPGGNATGVRIFSAGLVAKQPDQPDGGDSSERYPGCRRGDWLARRSCRSERRARP